MDLFPSVLNDSQLTLPSLTLYRRQCSSYANPNVLAYLSSTTEIKLLQFSTSGPLRIADNKKLSIPLEPVKGLCLKHYNGVNYVAVVTITKILIYSGKELYYENVLKINNNIVQFSEGFVSVKQWKHGFICLTKNANIHIFKIEGKSKIILLPQQSVPAQYCSMAVLEPLVYLGKQNGSLQLIQQIFKQQTQQSYKVKQTFETSSKLPILTLTACKSTQQIFCCTCQGQLYILNKWLVNFSCISIHHSFISRIIVSQDGSLLYTVGEDQHAKKFYISQKSQRKIQLIKQWSFQKIISLLLQINGKVYVSFYENPKLTQL